MVNSAFNSNITIKSPLDLNGEEIALWNEILKNRKDLKSPYFDLRYLVSCVQASNTIKVARIENDNGALIGFFPFQSANKEIQAAGSPICDYQGIICNFDDLEFAVKKIFENANYNFEFNGWIGALEDKAVSYSQQVNIIDLSNGFENYYANAKSSHKSFFKSLGRRIKKFDETFPNAEFDFSYATTEEILWVVKNKSAQYKRNKLFDVFECGWTIDLLKTLTKKTDNEFGLYCAKITIDGKIIAAELSLKKGEYLHSWFPTYDEEYTNYSVGNILTMKLIEHSANNQITTIDFGGGNEEYKRNLCIKGMDIFYGFVWKNNFVNLFNFSPEHKTKLVKLNRFFSIQRGAKIQKYSKVLALNSFLNRVVHNISRPKSFPVEIPIMMSQFMIL